MEKLEELLPGIEDYLCNTLAKEKLSSLAEKKRRYYVERLDVLKLPPSLPPRPEGLPKTHTGSQPNVNVSFQEDYLAKQRELSRLQQLGKKNAVEKTEVPPPDTDVYHDVDELSLMTEGNHNQKVDEPDDGVYEVPLVQNGDGDGLDPGHISEDSSTSYESYEEEDGETGPYQNQQFDGSTVDQDIALPRVKSKKKKKNGKDGAVDMSIKTLTNIAIMGELYQKGKLTWTKRYCVISNNRLLCYKSERDSKPVVNFPLPGYDIVYIEKEGKHNHVLRISHVGCETYWFSAELKDKVDQWLQHLNAAARLADSQSDVSSTALDSSGSTSQLTVPNSPGPSPKCSSLTNVSVTSSEGGSGDGVVKPVINQGQVSPLPEQKGAEKKGFGKQITDSLQTFFGTIGKKKGTKAKQILEAVNIDVDPDAAISGYLNVCTDASGSKKWSKRWCMVRRGMLECYKDAGDEIYEFSISLSGCEIQTAKETKRELAFKLIQGDAERVILEATDTMDQGRWLTVLIREISHCEDDDSFDSSEFSDGESDQVHGPTEDIYDEVYQGDKPVDWGYGKTSENSGDNEYVDRNNRQNGRSTETPPPLPSSEPPPLPTSEPPMDDFINSYRNSPVDRKLLSDDDASSTSTGVTAVRVGTYTEHKVERYQRAQARLRRFKTEHLVFEPAPTTDSGDEATDESIPDVIKCSTGPTIDQDVEVLSKAQNPILSRLRQEKTGGSRKIGLSDDDILQDDIQDLKRKMCQIKKKRAEIRAKKLSSRTASEKVVYDEELQGLDAQLTKAENSMAELVKLLATSGGRLRYEGKETNSSGSTSSTSNSTSSLSSPQSTNSPTKTTNSVSKLRSEVLSDAKKSKGLADRISTSSQSSTSSLSDSSKSSSPRGSTEWKKSTASINLSSSTNKGISPTSQRLVTSRTTAMRRSSSPLSSRNISSITSTRRESFESLLDKSPRTSRTTTTTSTASSKGTTLPAAWKAPSSVSSTAQKDSGSGCEQKKRVVQEKLKLWESIAQDSTC